LPERYLGRTLGKYRVDDLLGSGGFAWVYRGFDPDLGVPVALKVLKPQFAGDPDFEARFRTEASTAARLRHPNIITIYAVGRDGDAVYFAMDYLPLNLAARLQVMGTLSPALLVRLGMDVGRALGYAHREGVIHRDIKTDNILFDDHGNAVVADFGIARAAAQHAEQTGTNLVVGTPQYFAPEQARGRPVDGRTDLYALGVTLFHAATGRLPFTGADWYEIARQHVEEEPPSPRSLAPSLPRGLEQVILRCLEKDADDRYQSAEELCAELARETPELGPDTSAHTMAVPALDRLLRGTGSRRQRQRARRMMVGMAAAVGVVAMVGLLWRSNTGAGRPAIPADSSAVSAADSTLPPRPLAAAADSLGTPGTRDTAASPAPPPPPPPVLRISVPPTASVTVDGKAIPHSSLTRLVTSAGEHRVVATVPSRVAPCSSARAEQRITVSAGDSRRLELAPLACGQLELALIKELKDLYGVRYALTPVDGGRLHEGSLPLDQPLVLPVGDYRVRVSAPQCSDYSSERVHVVADSLSVHKVKPIC
jgi:serine/threonine-protein kinase